MQAGIPNLDKLETLDWVQAMAVCPQDPRWHAEGDVWTHSKMVLDAVLSLPEYAYFSAREQLVLQWAAILHDIGKPVTTETDEKGYIISPRHSKIGERMSRQVLWNLDLGLREEICAIVRLHGLPIWALHKEKSHRQALLAGQRIHNKLLTAFAKADMLGRVSNDQAEMLERIDFYKELCIEAESWEQPFSFENGHSTFRYFLKGEDWPAQLFDDTKFDVWAMSGIPGSGKDTFAATLKLPIISLDEIRKELGVKFTDAKAQGRVAQLAYERAKAFCAKKQSFIWNSTNLTADMRLRLLQTLAVYNPRFRWVYLETSYEKILEHRSEYIPTANLQTMFRILDMPLPYEGHEVRYIRRG